MSVFDEEHPNDCPFCGSDLPDTHSVSEMLYEAHEAMEKLALADPGTDEFDALLDHVRNFVGAEPE